MGKEKRLFLLAVMTVMMSTVGYSAQITVGNKENKKNETVLEVGKETGVDNKGTFTNSGTINVNTDKATGIFGILNTGGTSTNKGTITINKGVGIKVTNGTFINSTNKDIVVNVNTNKSADGKAIFVSGSNAIVENKGNVKVEKGNGIEVKSGTFNNSGNIVINKNSSLGNKDVYGIKSSANFNNTGIIENRDKILIDGGKFTNNAGGTVNNAGEVVISGGTFNNVGGTVENSGKISISGGKLISDENRNNY